MGVTGDIIVRSYTRYYSISQSALGLEVPGNEIKSLESVSVEKAQTLKEMLTLKPKYCFRPN